jgi:hypothetical protein
MALNNITPTPATMPARPGDLVEVWGKEFLNKDFFPKKAVVVPKFHYGPPTRSLVEVINDDCHGEIASFLTLSEVNDFQSTCSILQEVVREISEDMYKNLACKRYSEQHFKGIYDEVEVALPWREKLKQQVMLKKPVVKSRHDYSLDNFRVVISMEVPDVNSYKRTRTKRTRTKRTRTQVNKILKSGTSTTKTVSIVSPIVVCEFHDHAELTKPSVSVVFISDAMLDPITSPFKKYVPANKLKMLLKAKANAVAEAESEKKAKDEGEKPSKPGAQLNVFLMLVQEFIPGYAACDDSNEEFHFSLEIDQIDVSFLHSKTGRMAYTDEADAEDRDEDTTYFESISGFSPDSFRGDPDLKVMLDSTYAIEGSDVVIRLSARIELQCCIFNAEYEEFEEPEDMSKREVCLLFKSMLD